MKIIDESKLTRNNFSTTKIRNLLMTEDFRNRLNEIYGISDNNPFESSVNAISVSTDLCQAINEVMERNCACAVPVYNTESIIIEFNKERINITEGRVDPDSYLLGLNESSISITPSNTYHEVANMIRDNYHFAVCNCR